MTVAAVDSVEGVRRQRQSKAVTVDGGSPQRRGRSTVKVDGCGRRRRQSKACNDNGGGQRRQRAALMGAAAAAVAGNDISYWSGGGGSNANTYILSTLSYSLSKLYLGKVSENSKSSGSPQEVPTGSPQEVPRKSFLSCYRTCSIFPTLTPKKERPKKYIS